MCIYREFLSDVSPPLVRAKSPYQLDGRLTIDQGDVIAIIDGRPDLQYIKGQNQRTFDIGTFPRYVHTKFNFLCIQLIKINFHF